jgi:seryl-tRNA synthetase
MLDINLFREEKGGNPELIRISQRQRNSPVEWVDEVIALDKEWVKKRFEADQFNKQINAIQKQIGEKKKAKEPCDDLLEEKKKLEQGKAVADEETDKLEHARNAKLIRIGNIVHDSVVNDVNEDNNEIVRYWPEKIEDHPPAKELYHHDEIMRNIEAYEPEKGAAIAGHRGYFLKNYGVLLNQALINYGIAFLRKKNYDILHTPFFMNREIMAETAQLEQFDEELYKVTGDGDKYLIATSEQPISAFHRNEWMDPATLPKKYCGYSTCFRKEAGAAGKDAWGIFRVHQFEKIEQFVFSKPEESYALFDEMIKTSEEFYQSLKLPYRIVGIVSGALNNAAAKKYDLEAWFPGYGTYRELVSCSNCTDYQSRRMEIRYGIKKMDDKEKKYVHCLNSTLVATERAMCCILENYQTPEGVKVPEVLQPYMGGINFIPFITKNHRKEK